MTKDTQNNSEQDVIKSLVQSVIVCLIDCDNVLGNWWRNLQKIDQKIILEELEDTVYDWTCKDKVKNWITEDRMWLL